MNQYHKLTITIMKQLREDPDGFACAGYKNLYPELKDVDVTSLLKGLSVYNSLCRVH